MLNQYEEELKESQVAIKLFSDNLGKAFLREAKCHIAMGNATAALLSLKKLNELDLKCQNAVNAEVQTVYKLREFERKANEAAEKNDSKEVVDCMQRALEISPACCNYKLKKAEHLALMGKYEEAQEIASNILQWDKINADAIYIQGICLYYDDYIDKATTFFKHALKMSPDHHKARLTFKKAKLLANKKAEGNDAFKHNHTQKAYDLYSEALKIDPNNRRTNAKLFCNRALVGSKLLKHKEAANDCSKAIELDEYYVKAYQLRAKCYMKIKMYDEAVHDAKKVCQLDETRENLDLLREAESALERSKKKDYYKILGVSKNATDNEIRKGYHEQALKYHPDRHSDATKEVQKAMEVKFKEVGAAYAALIDPKRRGRYDRGED